MRKKKPCSVFIFVGVWGVLPLLLYPIAAGERLRETHTQQ